MLHRLGMPKPLSARTLALLVCLCSGLAAPLVAQTDAQADEAPTLEDAVSPVFGRRSIGPLAVGGTALVTGFLIPIDVRPVPAEGLDPADIRFALDRDIVGNRSRDAADLSDWMRNGAFLMPYALAAFTGPGDERWYEKGRSTLM